VKRALAFLTALFATASAAAPATDYRARLPQDEVIYLLMPDRFDNADRANDTGGLKGGRLQTGFDPTDKGFYHGGDLKGTIRRLDYIKGLGATAVWLTPVFVNKPVQGSPGHESSGYHGYWITDFTRVDPHLGTDADFKALVDAVHARGMKFYMDIVVNHTADVIHFAECDEKPECPYRSIADYPYQRHGGLSGKPINPGFTGESDGSAANFAKLTDPDYAYTVEVPPSERNVKVPAWLNDPIYYHNRGNSTFRGESSQMGDFVGLDDVFTENPRVIAGIAASPELCAVVDVRGFAVPDPWDDEDASRLLDVEFDEDAPLAERTAALAAPPEAETAAGIEAAVFLLDGQRYAVPVSSILEFFRDLPHAPLIVRDGSASLVNRRGDAIALYDMRPLLGLQATALPATVNGIVLSQDGVRLAMAVDELAGLETLSHTAKAPSQPGRFTLSVHAGPNGTVQLIDVAALLAAPQLVLGNESST